MILLFGHTYALKNSSTFLVLTFSSQVLETIQVSCFFFTKETHLFSMGHNLFIKFDQKPLTSPSHNVT